MDQLQHSTASSAGPGRPDAGCFEADNYGRLRSLFNTLLTGSPWQPGAGSAVSTSPPRLPPHLKGGLPPLSRVLDPKGGNRARHFG